VCANLGNGIHSREPTINEGEVIMGDRSPKSVNKKAAQKQLKANAASQKKHDAAAAKQVGGKK
jgi:hypothetical protein